MSTAASSHGHSSPPAPKSYGAGLGILATIVVLIIVIGIIKMIFWPSSQTKANDKQATSVVNITPQPARYSPSHDAITVEVSGKLSKKIPIPIDYYLSFVCDHDYEVVNGAGESFKGKANQNVKIGVCHVDESTKNLMLRFRTLDSSSTNLTINLVPAEIK